jgi:hypothetical protein
MNHVAGLPFEEEKHAIVVQSYIPHGTAVHPKMWIVGVALTWESAQALEDNCRLQYEAERGVTFKEAGCLIYRTIVCRELDPNSWSSFGYTEAR